MSKRRARNSFPAQGARQRQPRAAAIPCGRRLRFEPLEDRRLLAILTVNTLVDENNGIGTGGISLREAVSAAGQGDTINFSVTGTINLTSTGSGHIVIAKNLTIQGPGANLLTIKAFDPDSSGENDSDGRRVFFVDNDSSNFATVTISGLTLTNGDPQDSGEDDGGGAIFNRENLTLNNCVLTGNYAQNSGAIYNADGTLTLNDCSISNNSARYDCGGLMVQGGSLFVNRCTITNNSAQNSGGAVMSRTRPVTIVDSTLSGNTTKEYGGAIYQYKSTLSVSGSTIASNTADVDGDGTGAGGGIYNLSGKLTVTNSTISGNSAGEGGGGIFSDTSQTTTIAHTTIAGNVTASGSGSNGGGINSNGTTVLDHTIVAGNLKGASTRDDVNGNFDAFYSLIGDKRSENVHNTGGSLIGTTTTPINALLGPLASNGGLTQTRLLLSGSPALDAGNPSAVAGAGTIPQYDQRGTPFSRVVDYDGAGGARIDIGAVEMTPAAPPLPGDYNCNNVVDAADYALWAKTNGTNVQAYSGADGDGNGTVNQNDYDVWRSHFGNTLSGDGQEPSGANEQPASGELSSAGDAPKATNGILLAAMPSSSSASASAPESAAGVFDSASATAGFSLDLLLLAAQSSSADQTAADVSEDGTSSASSGSPAADHVFDQIGGELAASISPNEKISPF